MVRDRRLRNQRPAGRTPSSQVIPSSRPRGLVLRRDETELREAGASAAEIAGLREDRFGAEAAARLEALDASRAEWQRRVDAYREERDPLLADAAPEERAALLEDVRARHFDGGELLRIRAQDGAESRDSD